MVLSGISPVHGLFGCAGEGGGLECFDLRQRMAIGFLDAASACGAPGECRGAWGWLVPVSNM